MPFDIEGAKKLFFDRKEVRDALDKGTRKALSKFGSFVRTGSRRSIRNAPMADAKTGAILKGRRKKGVAVRQAVSQPGKPPFSHTGLLRKFILFGFDAAAKSVVIGPILAASESGAPQSLEEGGTTRTRRGKVVTIRPRPYMAPAFKAELPKAAQMFKDAIRR